MMRNPDSPLIGTSVLLTRPAGRSAALARRLRLLGARVVEGPTIAFAEPLDAAAPRRAVEGLSRFDWIVFSSATGVEFFVERWRQGGSRAFSSTARVASVGTSTASHLEEAGIPCDVLAQQNHAEGLAASLSAELREGDRVLWVRPEVARPVLAERLVALGAEVDAVAFYRTIEAPEAADVAMALRRDGFDVVVFTSPSTFERLVEADPQGREAALTALARSSIVAIGPVTATALERDGLVPASVAQTAQEDALVAAIRTAIERRR